MDAWTVDLDANEYQFAAYAGFIRQSQNVIARRVHMNNYDGDGYDFHVLGALGEYAASRALGLPWVGPGRLRAPDVGDLQIRTRSRDNGDLILQPKDNRDEIFVLVTGRALRYVLRGWIYAYEGQQRRFWNDPARGRPAFFVPQSELRAVADLPIDIKRAGAGLMF